MKRILWSILMAAMLLLSAEAARAGLDSSTDFSASREDLARLPSIEQSKLGIHSDAIEEHKKYLNQGQSIQDSKASNKSSGSQNQFYKHDILSDLNSIHPKSKDNSYFGDIALTDYKDLIDKDGYANKKRAKLPKEIDVRNYPDLSSISQNLNILGQDNADSNSIKSTGVKFAYESELVNRDLYGNKGFAIDSTKKRNTKPINDAIQDTKLNLNNININKMSSEGEMNLERVKVNKLESGTNSPVSNIKTTFQETKAALNRFQPADHEISQVTKNERASNGGKNKQLKNYAVVVGISDYQDRMKLRTSVNDANMIASLLESYGYEIIKLTDYTNDKPTKENIINKALKRIISERNYGNVVFYFSGHGETDQKGNFSFVLQDEKSSLSSYLSDEELRQYTSQIKNLAMIVDACNSGCLSRLVEDDQIVLASSQRGEPSNEIWFGDLSVFTYNLCQAIKEENEKRDSQMILLSECFYKAKEWTTLWASRHLLSQTPVIDDRTSGTYCLNARLT